MAISYRPGRLVTWLFRAPSRLYDWRLGWLLGRRLCRITHVGRKSGRRYRTVVEVVGRDAVSGELMVVCGFGRRADWYRNLRANDAAAIEVGFRRFAAGWRELDVDEAEPVMAAYERRNRLLVPLIRRILSRVLGWRYDGSLEARRKLLAEMPIIAFKPKG
ncbi:nitroreductase family deazaflavin-dependent oxidoreductase [Mycobacterium talmoniae]|uniref:Nitroreductase n=1 Tax=Mycobacterium talmoniae TaxID=1858794 RepID=A0A1S1NQJ2_9MYCO|nr:MULTISPECIES: nitroreductase family deazaflavin-dependent oxidoreductase [Mycobacterium]OHV06641.1 hypothetical protein BKN37_01330 [Mycobacterium talmoniae]PQM45885.1 hypothetical protein C1Y40_03935 [Mycobacterium talmoniae]TDH50877.1 nitroreductase family deazaflavin-dependent oxidoreductase [Mycobacterium eburneum]